MNPWIEGPPEKLEPSMEVQIPDTERSRNPNGSDVWLVGDTSLSVYDDPDLPGGPGMTWGQDQILAEPNDIIRWRWWSHQ